MEAQPSESQQNLTTVMMHIIVDKSTDNANKHLPFGEGFAFKNIFLNCQVSVEHQSGTVI